ETREIRSGANYGPVMPQLVLAHLVAESAAHVLRGEAGPYDIGEVHGYVVEDAGSNARIVGGGDERNAGPEAGSEDANPGISARCKPVEAGAGIDNRLARGVDSASDVAGDVVVGALEPLRFSLCVIRHRHAERADA